MGSRVLQPPRKNMTIKQDRAPSATYHSDPPPSRPRGEPQQRRRSKGTRATAKDDEARDPRRSGAATEAGVGRAASERHRA